MHRPNHCFEDYEAEAEEEEEEEEEEDDDDDDDGVSQISKVDNVVFFTIEPALRYFLYSILFGLIIENSSPNEENTDFFSYCARLSLKSTHHTSTSTRTSLLHPASNSISFHAVSISISSTGACFAIVTVCIGTAFSEIMTMTSFSTDFWVREEM